MLWLDNEVVYFLAPFSTGWLWEGLNIKLLPKICWRKRCSKTIENKEKEGSKEWSGEQRKRQGQSLTSTTDKNAAAAKSSPGEHTDAGWHQSFIPSISATTLKQYFPETGSFANSVTLDNKENEDHSPFCLSYKGQFVPSCSSPLYRQYLPCTQVSQQ